MRCAKGAAAVRVIASATVSAATSLCSGVTSSTGFTDILSIAP